MNLGEHSYFLGIDKGPNTTIGKYCSIAVGTYIHSFDNHACITNRKLVSTYDFGEWGVDFTRSGWSKGDVKIGNDVWMGEDVQILTGVTIGDGVIVGAHTVIGKDVPPYAVIVGNPYIIKRYRYSDEIIKKLLEIKWWDWDNRKINERLASFIDIDEFIKLYG